MLVLARQLNEDLRLHVPAECSRAIDITVKVTRINRGIVRLGIEAPRAVQVSRPKTEDSGE